MGKAPDYLCTTVKAESSGGGVEITCRAYDDPVSVVLDRDSAIVLALRILSLVEKKDGRS